MDATTKGKLLALALVIGLQWPIQAQTQPRKVQEPYFGLEFTVPEGWQYQKNEAGYLLGHNTITGIIVLTGNDYQSLEEVRTAALQGFNEEGGTILGLTGDIQAFGQNGLAGNYEGTMQWERVKAYSIALVSTTGGKGVTGMIVTTPGQFSDVHIQVLEQLLNSVQFSKPKVADVVKEWADWLKVPGGSRLHYLTSSGSSEYGGGYTSTSSETIIDLCPNGAFGFSDNASMSTSITAGSAYSASDGQGQGTWKLEFNGSNPVLVLNFTDGSKSEYELTYVEQKTYLNGYRYFYLTGKDGPGCY